MRFNNLKDTPASSGNFLPLPKGRYNFIISGAEDKTATSGNQYIRLELTCVDENTEDLKRRGRKIWANLNSNVVGQEMMKALLTYNQNPLADAEGDVDIQTESLIGMRINASVGTEEYDGNVRNNAKYFKAIDEAYANITLDDVKASQETASASKSFTAPPKSPFAT